MKIIEVNPSKLNFPFDNNEMGLRPAPKPSDANFNEVLELKDDISENGLMDIFSVRCLGEDEYEVINGSRRAWCCKALAEEGHPEFQKIPVKVSNVDEITSLERQVAGNATNVNTQPKQYAAALSKIAASKGYTPKQLAKKVGKSESFVINMLKFNRLPDAIRDLVKDGKMTITNAVTLTNVPKDMSLEPFVEKACTENTSEFAVTVNEAIVERNKARRDEKKGKEPEFILTEKKVKPDVIKMNLEKAKNLYADDPSDFNHGYLVALQEIFQIDERSAAERKAEWDESIRKKEEEKKKRKENKELQKKEDLKKYIKQNNITSLDQLTA